MQPFKKNACHLFKYENGMKKIITAIIICSLLTACVKENNRSLPENSFAFGSYQFLCFDDCAKLYKIEDQQLYADNSNSYVNPLVFSSTALANDKYLLAKPLQDSFPVYLEAHTDTSYGCPDCHDQGMIYIAKTTNGIKRIWTIDTEEPAIPAEIRTYIQRVKTILTQL